MESLRSPIAVGRSAAEEPDARFASVHTELDGIFADVGRTGSEAGQNGGTWLSRRNGMGPFGGWPIWSIAGLLALGGATLAVERSAWPVSASVRDTVAHTQRAPRSGSAASPQPIGPEIGEPSRLADAPPARNNPARGITNEASPHPARAHSRAGEMHRAGTAAVAARPPAPASPSREAEQLPPPPAAEAAPTCPKAYEAWCLRETTSAADRGLRDAYDQAVQAGVDRSTLKRIKHEWVHYRRKANKHPAELIQGYQGLTIELGQITANRVAGTRSERHK